MDSNNAWGHESQALGISRIDLKDVDKEALEALEREAGISRIDLKGLNVVVILFITSFL